MGFRRRLGGAGLAMAAVAGLVGCVAPLEQPAPLLVAYPGPGKTEPAFRQDDASCRAAVARPQAAAQYVPREPPPEGFTPGMLYLRCMVVRGDVVQPLVPEQTVAYGYDPAFPVFVQYGVDYPWLYAGSPFGFGFGFYGGYGFRDGRFFRGERGFEGFRDGRFREGFREGGFRDHGFREGGFRDGGVRDGGGREGRGFRDGGGFRH